MIIPTLQFTASVMLPVCVMLLAGYLLKKAQFIDDHFIATSSRLLFHICLPALLFLSLSGVDPETVINIKLVMVAVIFSVFSFILSWLLSIGIKLQQCDRGVFVQGAARGNLAIVGLALIASLYGDQGVAAMSVIMAFLVPLFNILSVLILGYYSRDIGAQFEWRFLISSLVRNPLIMAVILGVVAGYNGWSLPPVLDKAGRYFSSITLPLALICIGGSLSLKSLAETSVASCWAALFKTAIMPLLFVPVVWWLGFRDMELGVLFLAFACPTAAASFVMAKSFNGNSALAANIIVLSTLLSMPAIALGLYILRFSGMI